MCLVFSLAVTGCMGPTSLHRSVLGYDETISLLEREMLLINIARVHGNIPTHYTVTSNIAATFNFRTNAGFLGRIFERASGDAVSNYALNFGVSASENPTINIVPISGEAFSKRILSPMYENKFLFLVFQGAPIDMVMRLMVRGIEITNEDGSFQGFFLNNPVRTEEYTEFRKRVIHLDWLNTNRQLFVGRIPFRESVRAKLESPLSASDLIDALERGYHWHQIDKDGEYVLSKPTMGRVLISNYDPGTLSNKERKVLNTIVAPKPSNFILVDIRPEFPGGDYPLFGSIKLRSFNEIIEFIAAGIERNPEFNVDPDPHTGIAFQNPRSVLSIMIDEPSPKELFSVSYGGHDYSIKDTPWDYEAFKTLHHLFQMTVTDVTGVGIPITISK
jgi:hypothetical protein